MSRVQASSCFDSGFETTILSLHTHSKSHNIALTDILVEKLHLHYCDSRHMILPFKGCKTIFGVTDSNRPDQRENCTTLEPFYAKSRVTSVLKGS
jgi:hypothetical protein